MIPRAVFLSVSFFECLEIGAFIYVMTFHALFVLPAFYRVFQRFSFIIRKKIADISIILELLVNGGFALLFFFSIS